MNSISKRLCFLALTALVTSSLVALAAAPKKEADFVSMFDGKTLDGWEATPATTAAAWTVRGAGQLFEISAGTKLGKHVNTVKKHKRQLRNDPENLEKFQEIFVMKAGKKRDPQK